MLLPAEHHFKECMDLAGRLGDDMIRAKCLQHLGQLARQAGDSDKALAQTEQSLKIFNKHRDTNDGLMGVAVALHQIGMIHTDIEDFPTAEKNILRSLDLSRYLGDVEGLIASYAQIGLIYRLQGRFSEAISSFRSGKAIASKLGMAAIANKIDGDIQQTPQLTTHAAAIGDTSLQTNAFSLANVRCNLSTRINAVNHVVYTMRTSLLLRNSSSMTLHVEFVEPISESITFASGESFTNRKSLGKKQPGDGTVKQNAVIWAEWDETHETDGSSDPAFVEYRILVKVREKFEPLSYMIRIPANRFVRK